MSREEKPHISVHQMATFAECELRWEFRYIEGIKAPPGVAALIGKGTDQAVNADMTSKMLTGTLLEIEEVRAAAADSTRREWETEEPALTADEKSLGKAMVLGDAVDTAVGCAELYHREAAPNIVPLAVQDGFRLELEGWPFDLVGIKDLRTPDGNRDTKTAGKTPAKNVAARSIQMAAYDLDSKVRGQPHGLVALDFLVKKARPEYVERRARIGEREHNALLDRIDRASRAMQAGVFVPTEPDNWWCSEKFCGYWNRCAHGGRARVAAPVGVKLLPVIQETRETGWGDVETPARPDLRIVPAAPSAPPAAPPPPSPAAPENAPPAAPAPPPAIDPDPLPSWAIPPPPAAVLNDPAPVTKPRVVEDVISRPPPRVTPKKPAPKVADLSKALNAALEKKD